ncbi:MAG: bifunctional diaminohydroxyphosphoribosylaminopyrimidine deaminase/5-amino-6-(5-phosphoribosylamino)uracil reductase RibD [Planctomycetia bacterium]|nr:bifunctional diaminohydroxyphosphoribosylaminopyrimidine deaminase/5-amino-6-(5-phosphoribosylamino)uracil reductase RibD [Planctomycetia bacterium]
MARALELAALGRGGAEPNPLVGCVIAQGAEIIGEGYHRRFGGPHAEVAALAVVGERARGATAYVTLEPCCHFGKTPPCTKALLAAGVRRVVVAMRDPFPKVDGGGIEELRAAGVEVEVGLLEEEARRLNSPYLKLLSTGRPWVIAKWAMTLDGKIATRTGDSRWISSEESRAIVHELRGRVDAVIVGAGTARADDPQLTARPPGLRTALRIVVDDLASLDLDSRLATTAREVPVVVAAAANASPIYATQLRDLGCEVLLLEGADRKDRLANLLDELGRRRLTNVLVEGGASLLGVFFDAGQVDEAAVFIAPKIVGGREAHGPVAGTGASRMIDAVELEQVERRFVGNDLFLSGRVRKPVEKADGT